jgi:signal transduction histidine kinase
MKKDMIAMVGAGNGGKAILSTLIRIPSVCIKYVCDINPDAPAMRLAKEHNIQCVFGNWENVISSDPEINLIFEVTGVSDVLKKLTEIKPENCILIAASGTRIILSLLDTQDKITQQLRDYKRNLELRIIERTEEIERANRELEEKIRDYEILNEKLQQINDQKTKYLLRAAHQLKAPFAAIQSYTDIITDGYTGEISGQTREIMDKIKARCEMLSICIKEMLELANLRTCIKGNIKTTSQSFVEIVKTSSQEFSMLAKKKKITLNFSPFTGNDAVKCNREQALILFSILFENAIIYSPENSAIEISFENPEAEKITVHIKDHGIGISGKNIGNIFTEFFRTNEAVAVHGNGTGLGLSIASEIASLQDFKIDVKSALCKGSAFSVTTAIFASA